MYWPDGLRTKRLTSSVTAAMRSPKVVLITFCWRMIFFSARSNGYIFAFKLVDIDVAPFGLVYGEGSVPQALCQTDECTKPYIMMSVSGSKLWLRTDCNEEHVTADRHMTKCRLRWRIAKVFP